MFKCLNCGKNIEKKDIVRGVRCPFCGYRILLKKRPKGVVKKIKVES